MIQSLKGTFPECMLLLVSDYKIFTFDIFKSHHFRHFDNPHLVLLINK